GHFTDVARAAGVGQDTFTGSSASWADYDGDGNLDLYVTNYAQCINRQGGFKYQADHLYHNNGNGTFTDVTPLVEHDPAITTDGATIGAGFNTAWFDYNGDGRPDLYLGNDYIGQKPDHNHLWQNRVPATSRSNFTDNSISSGSCY